MCRKGKKITRPTGETGVSEVEKQSFQSQAQALPCQQVSEGVSGHQRGAKGQSPREGLLVPEPMAEQGQALPSSTWPIKPPGCGLTAFPSALSCVEEIVAHASNVSSLVLGKGSGRLLATGGDDCRVNLWSINKPNCIMVSLAGQGGGDKGREGTVGRMG